MEVGHLRAVIEEGLAKAGQNPAPRSCPRCFGSGVEVVRGKGARPCECKRPAQAAQRLKSTNLPPRYATASFANFQPRTPSIRAAWLYAKQFVADFPTSRGLLLQGGVGTGKTHLAAAIVRELASGGVNCLFYEFGALLKEIQSSYSPIAKTSELRILAPVFEAQVLVLDELGASKPTDWVRDTLMQIINTRYNEQRLTIFTTNYLDTRQHEREETLQDRVGVRVRSRLYEMCRSVELVGPDFRREGK